MSFTDTRAGTVDGTNGVQVATVPPEDGSGGQLQAIIQVGNKTLMGETARTTLTAADAPTGGDLTTTGFAGTSGANLFDVGNCLSVAVRATCDTANATLTGRLVFYDGSNNPLGYSESMTFTSDSTLRLGNASGNFVAARQLIDAGQARKARFLVTSVSTGTWSVYCRPI